MTLKRGRVERPLPLARRVEQRHREGTNAWTNLQNHILRREARKADDLADDVVIHEEVLAQPMLSGQAKALQCRAGLTRIRKIRVHSCPLTPVR